MIILRSRRMDVFRSSPRKIFTPKWPRYPNHLPGKNRLFASKAGRRKSPSSYDFVLRSTSFDFCTAIRPSQIIKRTRRIPSGKMMRERISFLVSRIRAPSHGRFRCEADSNCISIVYTDFLTGQRWKRGNVGPGDTRFRQGTSK